MRLSDNKRALAVAEQAVALAVRADDAALHAAQPAVPGRSAAARRRGPMPRWPRRSAPPRCSKPPATPCTLGRAHWVIAFAQTRLSRNEASRRAAQRALELARQCGDGYGLANALNVLSFSCSDIAERLALLQQAAKAFERAGHAYGRMLVVGNLSLAFGELGLWRHACRLGEQCIAWAEAHGRRG